MTDITTPPATGPGNTPGPSDSTAMTNHELWNHLRKNGLPADSATAIVAGRAQSTPHEFYNRLRSNGVPSDSATTLVSAATHAVPFNANPSLLKSLGDHFANGATFGMGKHLAPLFAWMDSKSLGGQGRTAEQLAKQYDQTMTEDKAAHPLGSAAGEVAGAIASPINKVGEAVAGLTGAGRLAKAAVSGAVNTGIYGAANAPKGEAGEKAVEGMALGAPAGIVGDKAGELLGKGVTAAKQSVGLAPKVSPEEAFGIINKAQKAQADARYALARAHPDLQDDELDNLMQDPRIRQLWNDHAVPNNLSRGTPIESLAMKPDGTATKAPSWQDWQNMSDADQLKTAAQTPMGKKDPVFQFSDGPTSYPVRGIDETKKALDAQFQSRKLIKSDYDAMNAGMGKVLNRTDQLAPDYGAARQGFKQHADLKNAIAPDGNLQEGSTEGVEPWDAFKAVKGNPLAMGKVAKSIFLPASSGARESIEKLAPSLTEVKPDVLQAVRTAYPKPYAMGDPTAGANTGAGGAALLHLYAQQKANDDGTTPSTTP